MLNSINYEAWTVEHSNFPRKEAIENQIKFLLRYAVLAPSVHNIQPWRFNIKKNVLNILPDNSYSLPYSDKTKRGLYISIGACVTNILVAASYFKLSTKVKYDFESVQVLFGKEKYSEDLGYLLPYIQKRFSNKLTYETKKIPRNKLEILKTNTVRNIKFIPIDDSQLIYKIALLHEKATYSFMSQFEFRAEIARWLRVNNTKKYTGMPGFVLGLPLLASYIGKIFLPYAPFMANKVAINEKNRILKSPAIAILAARGHETSDLFDVGRSFQQIALIATANGIQCAPMAALIEQIDLTSRLAKIAGCEPGSELHMFIRMGYSRTKAYHTPRIPVNELLI